jgi:hypothetical protein
LEKDSYGMTAKQSKRLQSINGKDRNRPATLRAGQRTCTGSADPANCLRTTANPMPCPRSGEKQALVNWPISCPLK